MLLSSAECERMAEEHMGYALPLVRSGGWMGDHWLHTFALLAHLSRQETRDGRGEAPALQQGSKL